MCPLRGGGGKLEQTKKIRIIPTSTSERAIRDRIFEARSLRLARLSSSIYELSRACTKRSCRDRAPRRVITAAQLHSRPGEKAVQTGVCRFGVKLCVLSSRLSRAKSLHACFILTSVKTWRMRRCRRRRSKARFASSKLFKHLTFFLRNAAVTAAFQQLVQQHAGGALSAPGAAPEAPPPPPPAASAEAINEAKRRWGGGGAAKPAVPLAPPVRRREAGEELGDEAFLKPHAAAAGDDAADSDDLDSDDTSGDEEEAAAPPAPVPCFASRLPPRAFFAPPPSEAAKPAGGKWKQPPSLLFSVTGAAPQIENEKPKVKQKRAAAQLAENADAAAAVKQPQKAARALEAFRRLRKAGAARPAPAAYAQPYAPRERG